MRPLANRPACGLGRRGQHLAIELSEPGLSLDAEDRVAMISPLHIWSQFPDAGPAADIQACTDVNTFLNTGDGMCPVNVTSARNLETC